MPWYGWALLAAGAFLAVTAISLRLLRASRRGRRFMALSTRGKVAFGRTLLRDRDVPWRARLVLLVLVGYLAMPFDIIPDFLPVVGQLDDIAIIIFAVGLLILLVPRDRFDAAIASAEQEQERRRAEAAMGVKPGAEPPR